MAALVGVAVAAAVVVLAVVMDVVVAHLQG